ncbi:MAG: hypothetical protein JO250_17195 [Armatimonadetes bacterium]|nr:hypothetical protein [Armatimonadota bacterium]
MKPHSGYGAGLYVSGPAIFLFFLVCLAALVVIFWGVRRQEALVILGERARRRLDQGRALPTLWGLSAGVLVVAASALLMGTHVLALVGVLLLAAGFGLSGAGLAVAAWAVGDDLAVVLGGDEGDTLSSLRLGLWALFLTSWLPVIGWVAALLAVAGGAGAVLEALLTRRES